MKPTTLQAIRQAYVQLDAAATQLYFAAETAIQNNDLIDGSLLTSLADKIYEESENLDVLLKELE